ncbi:MAG: S-methyl-5-thioribose-1-phosphate isomerase [Candidatus Omnitrophica bacterium]|nr:S-methyl-5-thioribose-1-phosphate isomerase [Candidatus Omnitrophota bacterium]
MTFSPLFWPIELKGDTIYVLDETALPQKLTYIKVRTYQQAARAIKAMKTRAFGQVILVFYTFLLVLRQNRGGKNTGKVLKKVADTLNATRPTLPFKFLTDMVLGWQAQGKDLEKMIHGFLEMLRHKRIKRAEEVADHLKDGDSILTHCNVSGELPLIAQFCRKQGKKIGFYATETRPYFQGSRLTAWELQRAKVPVTLITDNMTASVISQGKVNKVIVGCDQLARNGDVANKIGTYQIAVLARHFKIPFYVLCPPASKAKTGKDIKIEVRPEKEMLEYKGLRLAPYGVKGYYPAFDITPDKFISKHFILEIGR